MSIESEAFAGVVVDFQRLPGYGFEKITVEGQVVYTIEIDFMDGDFTAHITIPEKGEVTGSVIDHMTEEEYLPMRVAYGLGAFAGTVRYEYEQLLGRIVKECCIQMPFISEQANRIARALFERHGSSPEFLWRDENLEVGSKPNDDAAAFRHTDGDKWYALIMHIRDDQLKTEQQLVEEKEAKAREKAEREAARKAAKAAKAAGKKPPKKTKKSKSAINLTEAPREPVFLDAVNIKVNEVQRDAWLEDQDKIKDSGQSIGNDMKAHGTDNAASGNDKKGPGIYPAFHMNHKLWSSVRLDDTFTDDQVLELIEMSFDATHGKAGNKGSKRPEGCREWIIPANPKYYDVVTDFDNNEESLWKQGKGIEKGDIIYMYVGVPHSAILYRCEITKVHLPSDYEGTDIKVPELMAVKILDRYEKNVFDREVLKKFGVTTVRGPRFMPPELAEYIRKNKRDYE